MKKFYIIAVMALASLAASAQQTLNLSTYAGTDITALDGQTRNITVNRYVFNGWNTICLPFSLSANEVEEAFGSDCRLETLVGVENVGAQVKLNFQDCKKAGIEANRPYILHYTGESKSIKISASNKTIKSSKASVSFSDNEGVTVTFAAAKLKTQPEGLYGILAKDNQEAAFVSVGDLVTNGFYATRCYIQLSNGTSTLLTSNHIAEGDITSVKAVMGTNERADVYNISGVKVASNASVREINSLCKGVYVVKGKKIAVK